MNSENEIFNIDISLILAFMWQAAQRRNKDPHTHYKGDTLDTYWEFRLAFEKLNLFLEKEDNLF